MSVIVHVGDYAFQSLLISSIETFPSDYIGTKASATTKRNSDKTSRHEGEAFGLLFGQRLLKKRADLIFNVTLAVPMQAAVHQKDSVSFSPPHFHRIREVTESFPYLEFLGTFHSHPCLKDDYNGKPTSEFSDGDELSALDIAVEYGDELLEVILGITALDNHSTRQAKAEGETIQSYCGRFKYRLSAYCTVGAVSDEEEEEDDEDDTELCLMPVDRLICPLAAHGGGIFEHAELSPSA
jgi:hypothetical protein